MGFYSAVVDNKDSDFVHVRCRVEKDLDALLHMMDEYRIIHDPKVVTPPPADYSYRVKMPKQSWTVCMGKFSTMMNYTNFKNAVPHDTPGRGSAYMSIWSTMRNFGDKLSPSSWFKKSGKPSFALGDFDSLPKSKAVADATEPLLSTEEIDQLLADVTGEEKSMNVTMYDDGDERTTHARGCQCSSCKSKRK